MILCKGRYSLITLHHYLKKQESTFKQITIEAVVEKAIQFYFKPSSENYFKAFKLKILQQNLKHFSKMYLMRFLFVCDRQSATHFLDVIGSKW